MTRLTHPTLLLLLFLGGCSGEPEIVCHPVRGQVTQDGKALAEAMIVLHPLAPVASASPKPIAYSDASGNFSLTTFQTGDGAPPGEYAVTVELRAPRRVGEEIIRDGRNLLPAKYSQPGTSGLRFQVVAGDNPLLAIKITP